MHSAERDREIKLVDIAETPTKNVAKPEVQKNFGTYATQYDSIAVVQRQIADRLIAKYLLPSLGEEIDKDVDAVREEKRKQDLQITILDAGAGTGYLGRALRGALSTLLEKEDHLDANLSDEKLSDERLSQALVLTAFDLAPEMLKVAEVQGGYQNFIEGDIEAIAYYLPSEISPFDFTMSSLAVQWCHHLKRALDALQQVTKQRLFITTLLDGTLQELEDAFKRVDDQQHILPFISLESATHIVRQLGGDIHHYQAVMQFPTLKALFKSLRSIGASALPARRKGLMGRNDFLKIDHYFQQLGAYQLTYHVAEIILPGRA